VLILLRMRGDRVLAGWMAPRPSGRSDLLAAQAAEENIRRFALENAHAFPAMD
jgi:hypothetical protein